MPALSSTAFAAALLSSMMICAEVSYRNTHGRPGEHASGQLPLRDLMQDHCDRHGRQPAGSGPAWRACNRVPPRRPLPACRGLARPCICIEPT